MQRTSACWAVAAWMAVRDISAIDSSASQIMMQWCSKSRMFGACVRTSCSCAPSGGATAAGGVQSST